MKRKGGKTPRNPKEPVVRAAFARVLSDLREKAGLTQGEVGEKSGYEEKYIGALERRKHTPYINRGYPDLERRQRRSVRNSKTDSGIDAKVCTLGTRALIVGMTINSKRLTSAALPARFSGKSREK